MSKPVKLVVAGAVSSVDGDARHLVAGRDQAVGAAAYERALADGEMSRVGRCGSARR